MSHHPIGRPNTIGWCVGSVSLDVASVRYRAVLPILALKSSGYESRIFTARQHVAVNTLAALVIVKTFNLDAYTLAVECRAAGVPVIIDLCDNIFVPAYGMKHNTSETFMAIARLASVIVVTTEPLAQVVRVRLPEADVQIIPDGIVPERRELSAALQSAASPVLPPELLAIAAGQGKRLADRVRAIRAESPRVAVAKAKNFAVSRLQQWAGDVVVVANRVLRKSYSFLRRRLEQRVDARIAAGLSSRNNIKRLLWFGNHGADYARFGMLDLLEIKNELECIAQEFSVELVVVSNNREKYEAYIAPLAIPSTYLEWSAEAVEACLSQADVVIIPNSLDPFSICKSANRTVHALMHGVPVVATATPALLPLRPVIGMRNVYEDLRMYFRDPSVGIAHVALAKEIIEENYGREALAEAWQKVLERAKAPQPLIGTTAGTQLIVALHLVQDLDLALPIFIEALRRGCALEAWCSETLLRKSARVINRLRAANVFIRPIREEDAGVVEFPSSVRALLSVTETNLRPHRFTRELTERAKARGIFTATLQHGVDNVGLTYTDDVQPVSKVDFASERIFLWGELSSLVEEVSAETKRKCLAVGCPKSTGNDAADIADKLPHDRPIIGVFENLHWHRYDDAYREFFLNGVNALAGLFPELTFLLKPHHAGLWLTTRYKGDKPAANNLYIADPQDPAWEAYTADGLLGIMDAVITSPSTVALDAARRRIPVAVVAHDLIVDNYRTLPLIQNTQDWEAFIAGARDPLAKRNLIDCGDQYVRQTVIEGDAAVRILDDLFESSQIQVATV